MFNYNKYEIVSLAKENGFRSETLEKVLRLIDILTYINTTEELANFLVLKGGTAINFTIFKLPRLSVDIDLDFSFDGTKNEMLEKRKEITALLRRYMEINGYILNDNTRIRHALDSFVFSYINSFGNKDNLKVEINFMNRAHIYEPVIRNVSISIVNSFKILTLNNYELFGSKIKALLERCTIRDIYAVYHMLNACLFNDEEFVSIKKCVIFYMTIGKSTDRAFEEIISDFYPKINAYLVDRIPQYLSATLRNTEALNMKEMVEKVKAFTSTLLNFTEKEKKFIQDFNKGDYKPSLLFEDEITCKRIEKHPMALWKLEHLKN